MYPLIFVLSSIVAYTGIAYFAQLTGGSVATAWQAVGKSLQPFPVIVLVAANVFFALAIYAAFQFTRFAIPATIAMGALTSFGFSVVFLGAQVTIAKLIGVALVVAGIMMLGI
jgi:multidrug transporter EmrE-like cation transporter